MESIRSGRIDVPPSATSVRRSPENATTTSTEPVALPAPQEPELSSLAKQLSAAVDRAAARDASLTRKELGALGESLWEKIAGQSYYFSKQSHDDFVPDTDDPSLLERAKQATAFVNGKGENPFKSLGREELSAIVYDQADVFTVNERHAAWKEVNKRDSEWTLQMTQKMDAERQRTGGIDRGIGEILDYLHALPPIEEAQILGNYDVNLRMQLSGAEIDWPEFNTSLLDLLANNWGHAEEEVEPDPTGEPDANLGKTLD
ncbi:hypothetical protein HU720_18390 [Pseudomonas sp. SWRI51]|uniref:hypothetical protein n=1 Tax=Pseudomonas sp. SWRI51 TaxID=2745491 RepID=UPI0016466F1A|nr:hypothetical protein [Pseudomonas sp. SWRI51]MBC3413262.1 hypothetical protein [Pseudomonas sp. SWRI51]